MGIMMYDANCEKKGKGYPRWKMVYELYDKDIDELYRKEEMRMTALEHSNLTEEANAEVEADAHASDENWMKDLTWKVLQQ